MLNHNDPDDTFDPTHHLISDRDVTRLAEALIAWEDVEAARLRAALLAVGIEHGPLPASRAA